MAENDGYINLWRVFKENPSFMDSAHVHVWIYLLLTAAWKPRKFKRKGKTYSLKPGQLITSRKTISNDTKVSESKVYRVLRELVSEQQIEQETDGLSTLITISNWERYQKREQVSEQESEQDVNRFRTGNEQRSKKVIRSEGVGSSKDNPPTPLVKNGNGKSNGRTAQARELVDIYLSAKKLRPRNEPPSSQYWPDGLKHGVAAVRERAVRNCEKLLKKYTYEELKELTIRAAAEARESSKPYMVTNVFGEKCYVEYYKEREELFDGI